MMKLPLRIAFRYLFAKKSHNVINIVSAISAAGMTVGTAALIVILSVYNGFDSIVKSMFSTVEPDYVIVPAQGKHFTPVGPAFDALYADDAVASMCSTLTENVYLEYEGRQGTATVKGVDEIYLDESALNGFITDGQFTLHKGGDGRNWTIVGAGLARRMGMNPSFLSPAKLCFPDAKARFSIINPYSGINFTRVWPSGIFQVNGEIDSKLMLVDRDVLSQLLGVKDVASAVELRMVDGLSRREIKAFEKRTRSIIGPDLRLLDRQSQNPSLYKMLRYEKAAVYMIMLFVVLILGFCIFSSLSMLIVDKAGDIAILDSMGMDRRSIRWIFAAEGFLITLLGMCLGMVVGIVLCLVQQHFGIIGMPEGFFVESYPVIVSFMDIILSAAGISLCGYIIAAYSGTRVSF